MTCISGAPTPPRGLRGEIQTMHLGQALAFLVLFFWQHVREVFVGRLGFLDRMCIHQQDLDLKARSIDGLASYLDCSDRLASWHLSRRLVLLRSCCYRGDIARACGVCLRLGASC